MFSPVIQTPDSKFYQHLENIPLSTTEVVSLKLTIFLNDEVVLIISSPEASFYML
jgi:hypothetical protein